VLTSNNQGFICYSSLCLIPRSWRSKHGPQQVLRGPIKSAERPTIGPRPPLGTMLFVKYLDFSLVQSFEFSLDNSLIQDTLDIVGAG